MSPFLDTSVVVRYLVNEPPEMAEQAARIIEDETDLQITAVVLAEVGYVLTKLYRLPRDLVVDRLVRFVRRQNVVSFDLDEGSVIQALMLCRPSGRVSFADAVLWATVRAAATGTGVVYSFDERFPAVGVEVRRNRRRTSNGADGATE